jgi:OmpA-OmpF porin, OOP family
VKMTDLQLPGGMKISVPEGSFHYSLHQWLAGTTDTTVPKRFVFDNLNFETGSTQLTPESMPTVDSLVVILKAYPAVAVRLEGHTDSTGDAAANKKLSFDRAVVVKEIMIKGGIPEGRIGTDGYGQENPIAPNETEEGRAKNRRTELVVEKR